MKRGTGMEGVILGAAIAITVMAAISAFFPKDGPNILGPSKLKRQAIYEQVAPPVGTYWLLEKEPNGQMNLRLFSVPAGALEFKPPLPSGAPLPLPRSFFIDDEGFAHPKVVEGNIEGSASLPEPR